jgi:hypothetical protein
MDVVELVLVRGLQITLAIAIVACEWAHQWGKPRRIDWATEPRP